jgi:uncharacterized membrane protein
VLNRWHTIKDTLCWMHKIKTKKTFYLLLFSIVIYIKRMDKLIEKLKIDESFTKNRKNKQKRFN